MSSLKLEVNDVVLQAVARGLRRISNDSKYVFQIQHYTFISFGELFFCDLEISRKHLSVCCIIKFDLEYLVVFLDDVNL